MPRRAAILPRIHTGRDRRPRGTPNVCPPGVALSNCGARIPLGLGRRLQLSLVHPARSRSICHDGAGQANWADLVLGGLPATLYPSAVAVGVHHENQVRWVVGELCAPSPAA